MAVDQVVFGVSDVDRGTIPRGSKWDEVDLRRGNWIVPAARMKASREHRIQIQRKVEEILREAEEIADGSRSASPSRTGRSSSDSALSRLLRESGVQEVPHGFRSSFRDWCADTGQAGEIAEAALAHTVRGVEGACFRNDLFERRFERRRGVMEAWAEYISETVRS